MSKEFPKISSDALNSEAKGNKLSPAMAVIMCGLFFLLVRLGISIDNVLFRRDAIEINAVIDEIYHDNLGEDQGYTVYVTYEWNETTHRHVRLNRHQDSMNVGDTIKILIHENEPYNIRFSEGPYWEGVLYAIIVILLGFSFRKSKTIFDSKKTNRNTPAS